MTIDKVLAHISNIVIILVLGGLLFYMVHKGTEVVWLEALAKDIFLLVCGGFIGFMRSVPTASKPPVVK